MPTPNVVHIQNQIPGTVLSISISSQGWNCCDWPNPGDVITDIDFDTSQDLNFARKGGHGCDGDQGYFVLDVAGNGRSLGSQGLNISGDGGIFTTGGFDPEFRSVLSSNGDGTYQWLIY